MTTRPPSVLLASMSRSSVLRPAKKSTLTLCNTHNTAIRSCPHDASTEAHAAYIISEVALLHHVDEIELPVLQNILGFVDLRLSWLDGCTGIPAHAGAGGTRGNARRQAAVVQSGACIRSALRGCTHNA